MTEKISATRRELWLVAQRGYNFGTGDILVGRYVGVTVVDSDEDVKFEPVMLSDEGQQGLLPADYEPTAQAVHIAIEPITP